MRLQKVYIGFAVDMDRAYDTNSRNGIPVREDHPNYLDRVKHKETFVNGMEILFNYFKNINAEKGVTWFVNEASYLTTIKFPEILKKCIATGGEIGLHTHFNSSMFNSSQFTMPNDSNIWEKDGIIEPKKRLEDFLKNIDAKQKKIIVFKAGNHIRNDIMFQKLIEHGFEIDTTYVANTKEIRNVGGESIVLFDDSSIDNEPFEMNILSKSIFEIPEMHPTIKKLHKYDKEFLFARLQIHPWEAFEDNLKGFTKFINYLNKNNIDIEYLNCEEMKKKYKEAAAEAKQAPAAEAAEGGVAVNKALGVDQVDADAPAAEHRGMNNIKLIIWDLDNVLWNDILAEKTNIINNERYNLSKKVIPFLNEHGIINSICSKNTYDDAKNVLEKMGIFNYFIFPKISFSNKGGQVKKIIDECNFRPVNVVFVDDNIVNRKEVLYHNAGIIIKDENFLFNILENKEFLNLKKKNRLEDYKLLEKKMYDKQSKFNNNNEDFLKSLNLHCNLYLISNGNFHSHKDRILEIINRTNQLNYTKKRVDTTDNILALIKKYKFYIVQAEDIYTSYNTIGIVCLDTINNELIHFCFSCRLMGLMIENKLYEYFEYPKIKIIEPVAIPLKIKSERDIINWILINNNKHSELFSVNKLSYSHTDTLVIRGSCEISYLFSDINRLNNLFIKIQDKDKIQDNQFSLEYLSQDPSDKNIEILSQASNNLYNYKYFTIEEADIYIFSIADMCGKMHHRYLHKKSNIIVNMKPQKNNKKAMVAPYSNQFIKLNIYSQNEFENIIKKIIEKYKNKIIIFQNGFNNSPNYKDYNPIIKKYINSKNIFLLDINKFAIDESYLVNKHHNHYIQEVNIQLWIELVKIIRDFYNKNSNPIFFSNFFENMYVINNKNIKVNQIFENIYDKRLLTLQILYENNEFNNGYGIYFSFPTYFIKKYNRWYPIKKYKLKFYAKISSENKNNIINKIKIFTGMKWNNTDLILTKEYKEYDIEDIFDFNSKSTYRISFTNPYNGLCINIFNPTLIDI